MSKLNAVQKRSANSAVDGEEEQFLADLRGIVWSVGGSTDGSWKALAKKANVSPRTVANFAVGYTKRPTLFTIRRIFVALGYRMTLVQERRK